MTYQTRFWFPMTMVLWLWASISTAISLLAVLNLLPGSILVLGMYTNEDSQPLPLHLYELFLWVLLLIFNLIWRPPGKVWFLTWILAALLLIKTIWLVPLLISNFHWEFQPLASLPAIFLFSEFLKLGILLLISYYLFFQEKNVITRKDIPYFHFFRPGENSTKINKPL